MINIPAQTSFDWTVLWSRHFWDSDHVDVILFLSLQFKMNSFIQCLPSSNHLWSSDANHRWYNERGLSAYETLFGIPQVFRMFRFAVRTQQVCRIGRRKWHTSWLCIIIHRCTPDFELFGRLHSFGHIRLDRRSFYSLNFIHVRIDWMFSFSELNSCEFVWESHINWRCWNSR